MRSLLLTMAILGWIECYSQSEYEKTLDLRVEQIKNQHGFDNNVVVHIDSVEYYDLRFPYWKSGDVYYLNDISRFKNCSFESLKDSLVGKRPDISPDSWRLVSGPHPYLFLKDTATIADLNILIKNEHPFVKVYAFAALSFRKHESLISIIFDNLADNNQFEQMTADVESNVYPAEMMIQYQIDYMSKKEKKNLISVIKKDHKHLMRCLKSLE